MVGNLHKEKRVGQISHRLENRIMFDKTDLLKIPGIESVDESFNCSDGGFKQVYACTVGGKKNAIKVTKVADKIGSRDITLQRLRREIELLGELKSQFLPKLGDLPVQAYIKEDDTFIVYSEEFIEGSDTSELIEKGFFEDKSKIVKLLHDTCSALKIFWDYKHTVHRDVKPANIRFSKDTNSFILIDAGIALIKDKTTLTPTGHGSPRTPIYTSPEVIKSDRNLSFRTDLFSLGIVLYEAVSGKHPFYSDGMSQSEIDNAILNINPEPIKPSATLPQQITDTIMQMLNKRPHQRPNNLDVLINLGT